MEFRAVTILALALVFFLLLKLLARLTLAALALTIAAMLPAALGVACILITFLALLSH